MDDLINGFLTYLKNKKGVSPNTIEAYKQDLKSFNGYLTMLNITAEKANKTNIMAYLLSLQKKGVKPSTLHRNLSSLRNFYKHLFYSGLIKADPCYELEAPTVEKQPVQVISKDASALLLQQPDTTTAKGLRDIAIFELLITTGISVSDLVLLKTHDLNANLKYISYETSNKSKIKALSPSTINSINEYILEARPKFVKESSPDMLFLSRNGKALTRQALWKTIKAYGESAGFDNKITLSMLKHTKG